MKIKFVVPLVISLVGILSTSITFMGDPSVVKEQKSDGTVVYKNVPSEKTAESENVKTEESESVQNSYVEDSAPASEQSESVQVSFDVIGAGIVVDCVVNGTIPARMMIDTGASSSLLTSAIVNQLNIPPELYTGPLFPTGVAGEFSTYAIPVNSLELKGLIQFDLDILILPAAVGDGVDGLLGMDFLYNYKIQMDPMTKLLTFEPIGLNEELFAGKPGTWWCHQFERLKSILEMHKFLRNQKIEPSLQATWNSIMDKTIDHSQRRLDDLWTKAAREGVPLEFRNGPCDKKSN